ncbi:MAG TPA: hypothetical protein VLE43_20805 [Candidatus Saccharimonadia bacterium]|nr:hypothetical protein [Candidatus Saccharimonadia bacterium]
MTTVRSRRTFLKILAATSLVAALPSIFAADRQQEAANGIAIGTDRQLFIDDVLVDLSLSRNITRTLNPPKSIRCVLKPDQPWEALGFIFYCSVVDDGGAVKLFYGSYDAEKKKHFSLATSSDGLHWERPKLGLKTFQGSKDNNILPVEAVEAAVFLDPHAPSAKRFRLIYTKGWPDPAKAGVFVASSNDGVHWASVPERLFPFVPDSQPSAVWDEGLQQYAIYLRAWNPNRTVARVAVSDLEAPWPYDASVPPNLVWGKDKIPVPSREIPTVLATDEQDPANLQFYTSAVVKYPFAPNVFFAFPAAFQLWKGDEWKARACNTADGTFDVQFAASRDGIAWHRWREPYIGAGVHDGLDLRIVSMGPGMVRRGRVLYQYFVGDTFTHGRPVVWDKDLTNRAEWLQRERGGIYCATQRVDGFVSMNAANTPGTLTTQPLLFRGNRLFLNIHTAGSGSVKVALLQPDGTPHPGFTNRDCELISADEIDYEVRWKDGAAVSALAGKPVRVQLEMRNAKLYALQFGTAQK